MNNFSDIVAFVRVAEAHSFVAAAQTLGMSPSAISKAITRLEERLGARLLNRTTRSLSLTDVGQNFYESCRVALGQLDQAESEVTESRGTARGVLRVEVPISLGRRILVPALPRFIAQHPDLSVQMTMNDRVVDLVHEGMDAALRVGNLSDSSLIARRVAQLRGVTCASPEFIERYGVPNDPTELLPEHCIIMFKLGSHQIREWLFRKGGVEHKIVPAARLVVQRSGIRRCCSGEWRGLRPCTGFHGRSASCIGTAETRAGRLERGCMVAGLGRLSAASSADREDQGLHRLRFGTVPAGSLINMKVNGE